MNLIPPDPAAHQPRFDPWLRWRFHASMLGVLLIDFCFALIYQIPLERFALPALALCAGTLAGSVAIFAPIAAYLRAPGRRPPPIRRIAGLHVICTAYMAALLGVLAAFKFAVLPRLLDFDITTLLTANELLLLPFVHWAYYTAVVYFVMTDYEAVLREAIFERAGHLVPAGRGRFLVRLLLAFGLTSALPLALIVLHVNERGLDAGGDVLGRDLWAMALGVTVAVVFVTRSLLRPVRVLESAVRRVAADELPRAVPILSNDETGRLARAFNRMLSGLAERALIRETFGKYVPDRVAAAILRDGGRIEPRAATATILYTDIEGFTALAESLGPERTLDMLNEYFSAVIAPVEENGGVVNQFQGDAMLVTFNVPVADARHADAAVRAGLAIVRLCAARGFAGIPLRTRVGIATGPVIAGAVGSDRRVTYTVHGDAVNLAARLESLCRPFEADLLVDGETVARLASDYGLSAFGTTAIRGRAHPIALHGVARGHRGGAGPVHAPPVRGGRVA